MTLQSIGREIFNVLDIRKEKLVLAESCTSGGLVYHLGLMPGISRVLCGSAVVYRSDSKNKWLGISKRTMQKFTTESQEIAEAIASGVLSKTPEATWSLGIVGHMGPNAPEDKSGMIYFAICRRTKKNNIKICLSQTYKLSSSTRQNRIKEACEVALTYFARNLKQKKQKEDKVAESITCE